MFFLKVALASPNIDSAAGNAFLDTPRSCAPLTSVGFAHNEAIDIDEHNLLSTRTEDTETVCRNLQQEVFNEGRFKCCLIRGLIKKKLNIWALQSFQISMKTFIRKLLFSIPSSSQDSPCFMVQMLFQLSTDPINEMLFYETPKLF